MDSIIGITKKNWFQLLKENNFDIDMPFWVKASIITFLSMKNSKQLKREIKLYDKAIQETKIIKAPVFILGHWRSGTTFLHNLISLDKQFAYPNLFEVKNPFTFLSKSDLFKKRMELHSGKKRPMDNIKVKLDSPSEEEFALAVLSLKSPLISWMFPKNSETYDRYLTFKNASDEDYLEWQNAFIFFLKKLTLKYKKQLLLKSPTNTARIQFLYKLFPEGKFIHIHRNPYNVFKSTKKLFRTAVTTSRLQKPDSNQYDDYIIKLYNEMYDAFFKDRNLLDDGQFIDIAFEDIEAQPLEVIKKIYGDLKIDGFEQMKPDLDNYIQEYSNYEKNKYNEIDDDIRQKIARNCTRNFETWGYEL